MNALRLGTKKAAFGRGAMSCRCLLGCMWRVEIQMSCSPLQSLFQAPHAPGSQVAPWPADPENQECPNPDMDPLSTETTIRDKITVPIRSHWSRCPPYLLDANQPYQLQTYTSIYLPPIPSHVFCSSHTSEFSPHGSKRVLANLQAAGNFSSRRTTWQYVLEMGHVQSLCRWTCICIYKYKALQHVLATVHG